MFYMFDLNITCNMTSQRHAHRISPFRNRKLHDVAEDLGAMAATLRQCVDTDPDQIVVAHSAAALDAVEQIKLDFFRSTT